ncbi:MAG: mismatch-specific DNA-glycosylase, partial [Trebonia sp.]
MTTPGHAEPGRFRGETLPDLLGPHTRLLFVGVNPGLSAVAVQAPFPRRGNRFYPALFKAGITDRLIDASAGFAPGDREYLTDRGIGITALVSRATARAAELSTAELRAGARDLLTTVTRVRP